MRKITFYLIALLPQKIIDMILLEIKRVIADFFGLPPTYPMREYTSTPIISKGNCRVIELKNFQKIDKTQDNVISMKYDSIDDVPPEIKMLIILNIMDAFSKKFPIPYHQRRIIRDSITQNNRNEKYQILQNLN